MDAQGKVKNVSRYLMEPVVNTESEIALLQFKTLARDCPEWLQCWPNADPEIALDSIDDESVDFGPSCVRSS